MGFIRIRTSETIIPGKSIPHSEIASSEPFDNNSLILLGKT
jgi:hypothetical protein